LGVELERFDLGPNALGTYGLERIQWWCPYCALIPLQRDRLRMEQSHAIAAMLNELERRITSRIEGGKL